MRTRRAYPREGHRPLATLVGVDGQVTATREVLDAPTWRARRAAHECRVDAWTQPHLERRRRGESHPVEDFLFTYYTHRPAALRRWHPGFGVVLEDAEEYVGVKGYEVSTGSTGRGASTGGGGAAVAREHVLTQRRLLRGLHNLLTATASRPPQLGCFGMHEWAMVYRLDATDVRHSSWPLRLGATGTDQVVEGHRIACSHFDAFRFFTDEAGPRNTLSPGRDDRAAFEQPGCLHAGMDLYKHCLLYTSPSPRDKRQSRMPSSA